MCGFQSILPSHDADAYLLGIAVEKFDTVFLPIDSNIQESNY